MDNNKDIVVYLNDNQFNQLLETMKSEKETTTSTSSEVSDPSSESTNTEISEFDLSCFILLAEFIIIGILAWSLVMRK